MCPCLIPASFAADYAALEQPAGSVSVDVSRLAIGGGLWALEALTERRTK